jgi:hypothetical protein
VAHAVFDQVGTWIAAGAATLLGRVADVITETTAVDLNAGWFKKQFDVLRAMAVFVLLPMLLAAAISAIIRQDPGRLLRAVLVYVPLAVLGTALGIELVGRALQVTDLLSNQVASSLGNNTETALRGLGHSLVTLPPSGPSSGGFVVTIGALVLAFGSLLVWLELLVRAAAIYVAVVFLPLVLSGLVWPTTARWTRRLVEVLVALILSKFIIVTVLSLAAGALAHPSDNGDAINGVLAGAALLLVAAFAPFVLLRLVPIVEAGVIGHLEGIERRPVAAGTAAASQATTLAMGAAGRESSSTTSTASTPGTQPMAYAMGAPLPPNPSTSEGQGTDQSAEPPSPVATASRGADE